MKAKFVYDLYYYYFARFMAFKSAESADALLEQWGDLVAGMRAAAYALGYGENPLPNFER